MIKKLLGITLIFALIFGLFLAGFAYMKVESIENHVINPSEPVEFKIDSGANLYAVANRLKEHGDFSDIGFKIWLRLHPEYKSIQAGLYELSPNTSLTSFIDKISTGQVKQFSITLLEGHTFRTWLALLNQQDRLVATSLNASQLYNRLVTSSTSFCANQYSSLEGCLLPDTYFYTANTSVLEILQRAYSAMQQTSSSVWENRFVDIPLATQYEALILASIIEKETAIAEERFEIAGVFANRLEQNMRLQTDPTVIYGIGESFNGDITRKDLRTKTPYNTYMIDGLPITPIAMPSRASLEAAVAPAITDALYFVASGNGGHVFSTNLADHNKAVQQYLKQLKQR